MSSRKPRSQALLSEFYGLPPSASSGPHDSSHDDDDDEPSLSDESRDRVGDDTSSMNPLRREDFQVDSFVHDIISTNTVQEMVQIDNDLTGHIRRLDNDLQMLVYENYAKFISATDIIKEMKMKVDDLRTDMTKLTSTIDTLGGYYTAAEQVIDPSRAKIEKLLGLSRLVGRLNFLFDLPNRLRAAIGRKKYAKAVSIYGVSSKILKLYSHEESFRSIRVESDTIIREMKIMLRWTLQQHDHARGTDQIGVARLLLELGEEPSLLWHDILGAKRDRILIQLDNARRNATSIPHELKSLRMSFLDEFVEFALAFRELFSRSTTPSVSPQGSSPPDASPRPTAQDAGITALCSFTRQVHMLYLEDARAAVLKLIEEMSADVISNEHHRSRLDVIVNETMSVADTGAAVEKAIPSAKLGSHCKEVIDAILKRTIGAVFEYSQERILVAVSSFCSDPEVSAEKVSDCVQRLHDELRSAILDLNLISRYHRQVDKFSQDSLFLSALADVQSLILGDNPTLNAPAIIQPTPHQYQTRTSLASLLPTTSTVLLHRSRLCRPFQRIVLPELFEYLASLFSLSSASSSPAFNRRCATLVQLFKESEPALLTAAARRAGRDLSALIDVVVVAAPIRPSDWVPIFKDDVGRFQQQLSSFLPHRPHPPPHRHHRPPKRPMRRNDLHRILSETPPTTPIFDIVVDGTVEALVEAALMVAFKAWIESVRVQPLEAMQFQQIEIDVHAMRVDLETSRCRELQVLLDEVLTSAMDMCSEESPGLPPDLVQRYSWPG